MRAGRAHRQEDEGGEQERQQEYARSDEARHAGIPVPHDWMMVVAVGPAAACIVRVRRRCTVPVVVTRAGIVGPEVDRTRER